MDIHLIWAQDNNNAIGVNGNLPWYIPEDLKNFKKLTLNKPIVMGRKTWDSLKYKPLPGRRNLVLSTKHKIKDIETFNNIEILIKTLKESNENCIFIIGGAEIYKLFWAVSNYLHITLISKKCKSADTFFPIKYDDLNKNFKKISTKKLSHIAEYQYWKKFKI